MELEIKVMWCKGLTAFNFFQKLSVYAAVSITPQDKTLKLAQDEKQEQKTPIDQEGNGNPEWNYSMKFDLTPQNISSNLHHLSLLFEIRNQGQLFGFKEIGEVRVPLKNLIESVGVGVSRLVSYEVRGPDGKHNGVLDFSYKVMNNADLGNCVSDSGIPTLGYGHCNSGNCGSDTQIQVSGYGHLSDQGSHNSGNCVFDSDSQIQVSAYGHGSHQGSQSSGNYVPDSLIQYPRIGSEMGSVPDSQIQYPKIDSEMDVNPIMPSLWDPSPSNQPPGPPTWGPPLQPPPPAHYSLPPPPPPRILPPPPPRHQQPYAYRPSPYADPYWAYHIPPPNYQQPTGGGYEYRHW